MSKQIDLEKLRARASGLPDSDGAIGPTWCTPTEVLDLLDHIAALENDAARYRWLRSRKSLTLETLPQTWIREDGSRYQSTHYLASGGSLYPSMETLDLTIDTAMEASNAKAD